MREPEDDLTRRRRDLPRSIAPPGDLWPGIEARIRRRPAREPSRGRGLRLPVWGWIGLAAAAAALLLLWIGPGERRQDPPATPASAGLGAESTPIPATLRALETQCTGADKSLQAAIQGKESLTGGAFAAEAQWGLLHLDEAIEQTREALAEHPGDAGLIHMLTNRYQKKLSLLRQALRAAGEV